MQEILAMDGHQVMLVMLVLVMPVMVVAVVMDIMLAVAVAVLDAVVAVDAGEPAAVPRRHDSATCSTSHGARHRTESPGDRPGMVQGGRRTKSTERL